MTATGFAARAAAGVGALVLFAACGDMQDGDAVGHEASAEDAIASVQGADGYQLVWEFEGGWDPERGLYFGEVRPAPQVPAAPSRGLQTVPQAGWCALRAEADGVAGSNPPNTVELVTEPGTYLSLGPFSWTSPASGCAASQFVPPVDEPGHVPVTTNYTPEGVTCADVTIRSFYPTPFSNVYAELTEFGGSSLHSAYGYPYGTGAPDPDGAGGVQPALGLWYYGDLDATGSGAFASTVQWTFRNGDATGFDFRGRVIAEYAEICGNGIDDDCDGRADEGCADVVLGGACVDDADCESGWCGGNALCSLEGTSYLQPATFTMGSPSGEMGRVTNETQHTVTLTRPFVMQVTEVTQGEWTALMGNNPSSAQACGASCPVERVNWFDALAYANAVSVSEGLAECYDLTACSGTPGSNFGCTAVAVNATDGNPLLCEGYRLPTESEWEYAARAGTTTATYAGNLTGIGCADTTLLDIAWFCGNASTSQPVGTSSPNAWGLHDMLGSVWEWTWDWVGTYPSSATDPLGPATGGSKTARGGAWGSAAEGTRAAYRAITFSPSLRNLYVGFRLARTLQP